MGSTTPAKILGIQNKGALEVGFDADTVIFGENINVLNTIIGGRVVFTNEK